MFENEVKQYLQKHGFGCFAPKAVLFDMDGVLYDSMPNHSYSWHHAMEGYGLEMSPEDAYLYEGMRGVETIKLVCKEQWDRTISDEESARMYARKSEVYSSRPKAEVMPGVRQLIQQIHLMGMTILVVTGSGQLTLLERLAADFAPYIQPSHIISAFDVKRGKPHPEPYLMGLQKAGVAANEAIVIENAPMGVEAGVAAGIFTIAVNTGPLPDQVLVDRGANLLFPDMTALATFIAHNL